MAQDPQEKTWIQHTLKQAPWRTQAQGTSLVMAVVVIVAVIGALYLAQVSRTATAGRRLQSLEAQRQVLEQQNAQLRAEIAALRSVPRLIAEAERLGYHAAGPDEVEYMTLPGVSPPSTEAPSASPTPESGAGQAVSPYTETLESWLTDRLADFRAELQEFIENTFGQEPPPDA